MRLYGTKKLAFVIILFFVFACSVSSKKSQVDLTGKTYVHALVQSKEECNELHKKGVFNCARYLEFNSPDKVDVIFSDIVNEGIYSTEGNKIIIRITEYAEDLPDKLVFIADDNLNVLKLIEDDTVWKLNKADVDPWDL